MPTIDEVREALNEDFLAHPPSPENTLMRDVLLAVVNYVEKLDDDSELTVSIDHIAASTAAAFVNLAFRLYDVNTVTGGKEAIQVVEYIRQSFTNELLSQCALMAKVQLSEYYKSRGHNGNGKKAT